MKYIFFISRISAFLIDYLLFVLITYVLSGFDIKGYIISLLLLFLYRYLSTAFLGATLGMKLMMLKLKHYNYKICFIREISRFGSAFFYIGYIYALIDIDGRTFHDISSKTFVILGDREEKISNRDRYIRIASYILIILSILRFTSNFILDDIGLIGLKKIYSSDTYFQSFEGDNLNSLTQDDLYKKTLGRKYITVVDIDNKPYILRISNKLKYIEAYKLNLKGNKIIGEYIYKLDVPIQYICSGKFAANRDLCGISPKGEILLVDETGKIYAKNKVEIQNIITLKCGDLNKDGFSEAVVLGGNGEVEIFKYVNSKLERIYKGKVGEDILPVSLFIDNGIVIMAKGNESNILYHYDFQFNKFKFNYKKSIPIKGNDNIFKYEDNILSSSINRNAMSFRIGNIQDFNMYRVDDIIKKLYNFGERPGRRYAYMVRVVDDVYDIDGDGKLEIIVKAVGKNDVNGQGYIVEIYRLNTKMLYINNIFVKIESVFTFKK